MAEKMIKHLLYTYTKEIDNPFYVEGGDEPETVLREGLGRLGEVHDITRPYDLKRGEELGAFFTDEERKQIEAGKYRGVDAPAVVQARLMRAQSAGIQDADGESGPAADASAMSADELGDYIKEHKLNVDQTVDLADENDIDSINKVLDAENHASEGDPRSGVVKALEARAAKAAQSGPGGDED